MATKMYKMTLENKAELEAELEKLKNEGRIDIAEKLKLARSYGDLSENSEYDEAKSEQAKLEAKIQDLETQLDNAVIVESFDTDRVSMGSTVTLIRKPENVEVKYEIVGFSKANPSEGKISDESPVGKALVGAKVGETVLVEAPIGNLEFEIKEISFE